MHAPGLPRLRALAYALATALAACSDPASAPAAPLALSVTPSTITCAAGQTVTIRTTASGGTSTPSVAFSAANARTTVADDGTTAEVRCESRGSGSVTVWATDRWRHAVVRVP